MLIGGLSSVVTQPEQIIFNKLSRPDTKIAHECFCGEVLLRRRVSVKEGRK